ncbi:MAG: sugar phosphate isomerase/epimerase [Lentisphaerae bacterium]|jgi:sugar phosphate isomerase/epimerase|nr:sugar phosphate isomerase/epimerase [Lentisphaerota bacterium]
MAKKYRVAAQMFGFRDFIKEPAAMESTLKRVKKIGYDYVQISAFGPIEAAELKKICDGAGVEPIGAHVGIPIFRENEKKVIEDCHAYGVKYVAIPWVKADDYKTLTDWKKLFREMEGYAKRFAKEGLVVQYHNHAFELEKIGIKKGRGGKTILDLLFENTEILQAELDFGWIARAGYNPALWAKKLKGRLDQVHLKDLGIVADKPVFRAIGEGSIDWQDVIKACKAAGTRDFIIEQDACPLTDDPFLSYSISRKNLIEMGL